LFREVCTLSSSTPLETPPRAAAPLSPLDVDPETGHPWPLRFDTRGAARYLQIAHNLPIATLTLVRQRSKGTGIRWKFLGQRPIVERSELDRFVAEDALRDVSPLKAGALARAERERQAAKPKTKAKTKRPAKR
jgi:hypothetical protein